MVSPHTQVASVLSALESCFVLIGLISSTGKGKESEEERAIGCLKVKWGGAQFRGTVSV